MIAALQWVLGVATILGGVAAIVYFMEVSRKEKSQWVEKEKEVNSSWWESSDLKKQYDQEGYEHFRWSNSDLVAQRVTEGMEIIYEMDAEGRVKYKLVNESRQVLLGHKST